MYSKSGLRFAVTQSITKLFSNPPTISIKPGYYKNFAKLGVRANPRPLLLYKWGSFV